MDGWRRDDVYRPSSFAVESKTTIPSSTTADRPRIIDYSPPLRPRPCSFASWIVERIEVWYDTQDVLFLLSRMYDMIWSRHVVSSLCSCTKNKEIEKRVLHIQKITFEANLNIKSLKPAPHHPLTPAFLTPRAAFFAEGAGGAEARRVALFLRREHTAVPGGRSVDQNNARKGGDTCIAVEAIRSVLW